MQAQSGGLNQKEQGAFVIKGVPVRHSPRQNHASHIAENAGIHVNDGGHQGTASGIQGDQQRTDADQNCRPDIPRQPIRGRRRENAILSTERGTDFDHNRRPF